MSVYLQCPEIYTFTHKLKHWMMSLALHGQNLLDEKDGYIGGRGNFESIMLLWLPIFRWQHIFLICVLTSANSCSFRQNFGLLLQTLRIWWPYKLLDSLKMKAHFNIILQYFSWKITLRSLYCNFKCSHMLCSSIVIQITWIQLSTTS